MDVLTVTLGEARLRLHELVLRAMRGEETRILLAGEAVCRLVPEGLADRVCPAGPGPVPDETVLPA